MCALSRVNACTSPQGGTVYPFMCLRLRPYRSVLILYVFVCAIHVFWGLTHPGGGRDKGRAAAGRLALRLSAQSGSQ